MRQKIMTVLLIIYDITLSLGAIVIGIMMINSKYGIFAEYPKEWLNILPFESWAVPGIISIVIFGLGNLMAAIFIIIKKGDRPWLMSAIMGAAALVSVILQIVVLDGWYLASAEFLSLAVIQLCFCFNWFVI